MVEGRIANHEGSQLLRQLLVRSTSNNSSATVLVRGPSQLFSLWKKLGSRDVLQFTCKWINLNALSTSKRQFSLIVIVIRLFIMHVANAYMTVQLTMSIERRSTQHNDHLWKAFLNITCDVNLLTCLAFPIHSEHKASLSRSTTATTPFKAASCCCSWAILATTLIALSLSSSTSRCCNSSKLLQPYLWISKGHCLWYLI